MDEARDRSIAAVTDEAAQWMVRMSAPEAALEDRRLFVAWLKRSPVHLAEYLRMERTFAELARVDRGGTLDVAELLHRADDNVVELHGRAQRHAPAAPALRFASALAACAILALGAVFAFQAYVSDRYTTGVGEQRTVKLADGSSIVLNTGTKLRVDFSSRARAVHLLHGEALFNVAKDASRPFRVLSDQVVAQAVGTSFVVRRKESETVVTVLEGEVAVANLQEAVRFEGSDVPPQALLLAAGARADVLEREIRTAPVPNPAAVTAWKSGRLIFEGEALAEAVAEFNRYNRVELVLEDSSLSSERLSGVFDADKPQALVRFLERSGVIEPAHTADGKIFLAPRR